MILTLKKLCFGWGPAIERETHSQEEGSHSGKWDFFIVKLAWPVQVHWFRLEEFSYAEKALFSRPSSCSWVAHERTNLK